MVTQVEHLMLRRGKWLGLVVLLLSGCENITRFRGENPVRGSMLDPSFGEVEATSARSEDKDIDVVLLSDAADRIRAPIVVNATVSADHIPMRIQDFAATGATIDTFAPSASGYQMTVRPTVDGILEVRVGAGVIKGLGTGTNKKDASLTRIVDMTPPAVTMEWLPPGSDPILFPVKVQISELHQSLSASDFNVTNGEISEFRAGSENTYFFSTRVNTDGMVTIQLPGGKVRDVAGNVLTIPVDLSRLVDRTAPVATMHWHPLDPPPGNSPGAGVAVVISEAHNPLLAEDFNVVNGRIIGFASVGGGYQFTVESLEDGIVTVTLPAEKVRDTSGNIATNQVKIERRLDRTPPVVTMNWAADVTSENTRTVPAVVTVNESHVPLVREDFVASHGTIGNFVALPGSYNFDVTTTSLTDVVVTVTLPAGKVRDQSGNSNPSALQISRIYRRQEVASGLTPAKVTVNLNYAWTVASSGSAGKVRRILLDEAAGYPAITWNGAGSGGGHRTFVSPIGLIIGKTGGRIYRADEDVKSASATATDFGPVQEIANLAEGLSGVDRVCVTAFKDRSTGQEYIGAGYNSARSSLKGTPLLFSANEPHVASLLVPSDRKVATTKLYNSKTGEPVPAGKWSYQSDSIVKIDPSAFVEDGNYRIDYSFASTQTRRLFKRIPIDRTQPTKVRISAAEEFDAGASGSWGYSCYTDQGRNIFWSKNFSTGGNISGINMITGQPVPLDEAPNQAVTINLPDNVNFNLRSPTQSYAMAGGGSGFILSASSTYTASYETSSNLVFMSISGQRKLLVGKGECFSGEKINCAASDIKVFDPGIVLGPLSSLNDGRVVGLTRNTTSVYLLKAVDRNDLSKGIEVKNIKTLSGDPYMYTDFTGATAFAEAKEITIDLRSRPGFRADEDLSQPEVRWQSEAPAGDRWRGLTMSIRCYLAGNSPPPYQALNNVSSSGIWSPVAIASCSGVYDRVQIYLDGNGNADFARLNAVEFRARQ